MKKVVFIFSHLNSGIEFLTDKVLNNNPLLDVKKSNILYENASSLEYLFNSGHKNKTMAAIYSDIILHNYQFGCRDLYKICKFIYLIREPKYVLNSLINYKPINAYNYYCYRLRRIYETAKETGGLLLNWSNIKESLPLIENYLKLKTSLKFEDDIINPDYSVDFPAELLKIAQEKYEIYNFKIKELLK